MKKNKKAIIGILVVLIIVIGVVVAYKVIEKSVTNRENFNFKVENISASPVYTISNEKDNNKSEVDTTMTRWPILSATRWVKSITHCTTLTPSSLLHSIKHRPVL